MPASHSVCVVNFFSSTHFSEDQTNVTYYVKVLTCKERSDSTREQYRVSGGRIERKEEERTSIA